MIGWAFQPVMYNIITRHRVSLRVFRLPNAPSVGRGEGFPGFSILENGAFISCQTYLNGISSFQGDVGGTAEGAVPQWIVRPSHPPVSNAPSSKARSDVQFSDLPFSESRTSVRGSETRGSNVLLNARRCFSSSGFLQKLTSAFGSSQPAPIRSGVPTSFPSDKGKSSRTSLVAFETMQNLEARGSQFVASLLDREARQEKKQQLLLQSFYIYYVKLLMKKEGMFTFRDFLDLKKGLLQFLEDCEEEMGGVARRVGRRLSDLGLKAFKPTESAEFKTIANEIAILECFTSGELEATCPSHLGPRAIAAIAASAGVVEKDVKGILMQFSVLQGDRHWFMRRLEMGKPLPGSFEDRHLLAETDRPYELRLPYGEQFFNYEVQHMRKLIKARGDGRGDRRRAKYKRRIAIKCRLWQPKQRDWVDRWAFLPDFFSDQYSNFIARRDLAHRQRRQSLLAASEDRQDGVAENRATPWRRMPLGKRMSRRRCRISLDALYRQFKRRLPQQDPELRGLLQRALDADKARRDLQPRLSQAGEEGSGGNAGGFGTSSNFKETNRSSIAL